MGISRWHPIAGRLGCNAQILSASPICCPPSGAHVSGYPYANAASINLVDTKGKSRLLARKLLQSKRSLALEYLGDHV